MTAVSALPDLDEHQDITFLHHQVDFAALAAEIARQQTQAMLLQILQRARFGGIACDLPGSVGANKQGHHPMRSAVVFARMDGHNPPKTSLDNNIFPRWLHTRSPMTAPLPSLPACSSVMEDVARQIYPLSTLYVVATPIGNAGDITLRALHLLALADAIACEDTRNTGPLLARYGLHKELLAAHEHNEREAAEGIILRLRAGQRIALVSDAGTPGVSDPGARIVDAVLAAGLRVMPLPGASAVIGGLSASGLVNDRFHFVGFLPTKAQQREAALRDLRNAVATLVFYEAPHRIVDTVAALNAVFEPDRRIVFARELTKLFEEIHRCPLADAAAWLAADANRQKGEFVILLEGAPAKTDADIAQAERILAILLEECPVRQAAALAARITGRKKNALYELALRMKAQRE